MDIVKTIQGQNNYIEGVDTSHIRDTKICILGNNNTVIFGEYCDIGGLDIFISGDGNVIQFGQCVVISASTRQPAVINAIGGKSIKIGDGSLLSNNIEIHTTDYHGIYNSQGMRINPDKDIQIGKGVWIGLGVKILKGTEIGDGCVVGAGSLLTGLYKTENAIIAGNPAKIIRQQIFWRHERQDYFDVPDDLKGKWNWDQHK